MLAVAGVMARHIKAVASGPVRARSGYPCRSTGATRTLRATDGVVCRYCADGLSGHRVPSGLGGVFAGLVSTGVGEATLRALADGSLEVPVPAAAATSTVVVAATVAGAALTHFVQLTDGGLAAIPWNLLVWAVPGAIVGAIIGIALQGSRRAPRRRSSLGCSR
jgi:uncharacterized membrane protein YfcA